MVFVLSGLIGWECEKCNCSVGLCIYILVGVSVVLFMVLSEMFVIMFVGCDD